MQIINAINKRIQATQPIREKVKELKKQYPPETKKEGKKLNFFA
jgi:hypothetical protein